MPITRFEVTAKLELFRKEVQRLERIDLGCKDCEYGMKRGFCEKWKTTPPPEVVKAGCESWEYNEIPF